MYRAERRTWLRWAQTAAAVICAPLIWNGCGKTSAGAGSGETHFLELCDAKCDADFECLCGVCTIACTSDDACIRIRSDARCIPSDCGAERVCGLPCVGDHCATADAGTRDGGNFPNNDAASDLDAHSDRGVPPSTANDAEDAACTTSDGSSCYRPACLSAYSTCTLADTCAVANCGGFTFDESGCVRAKCQSDADCSPDERCALVSPDDMSCYEGDAGECICVTSQVYFLDWRCEPESIAGPRGEFQQLEIVEAASFTGSTGISSWTVTPDGHVEFSKNGVAGSAELTSLDHEDVLNPLVEGSALRVAMRDGIQCDPPPTDIEVTFRLQLSTQTLEHDETGCALVGPDNNVFSQLYQLVKRY